MPTMQHILLFPVPAWGHTKPTLAVAQHIVRLKPMYITLLTTKDFVKRMHDEFFAKMPDLPKEYFRVIAMDMHSGIESVGRAIEQFCEVYSSLVRGESLQCAETAVVYPGVPAPTVAILDFFAYDALLAVRDLSKEYVRIYGWNTGAASHTLALLAPENHGGRGNFIARAYEVAGAEGVEDIDEIKEKLYFKTEGKVMKVAGLPEMYDYENFPQTLPFTFRIATLMESAHKFLPECDGFILTTSEAFEGTAVQATKEWFRETSKEVYALCCMGHSSGNGLSEEAVNTKNVNVEVTQFMDYVLENYGPRALVYISFGTAWWTTETQKVWTFLSVLLDMNIPFFFSYASPLANIPEGVAERIKKSGFGYSSRWSPQEFILNHQATGWFVSHCGQNSTLESLAAGVPMICWPFGADQPTNAAHLSFNLNVAYELYEVRTGENGLKPLRRFGDGERPMTGTIEAVEREAREVLTKAMGDDGALKRRNAKKIKAQIEQGWAGPDGSCFKELQRFVKDVAE